ncbi:MAG: PIN/TRAM domain-containing protein [Phycisphaerales bacterium]|nr:PIN/TRAM domain-containing protein [Phycisphaerales bacterium]
MPQETPAESQAQSDKEMIDIPLENDGISAATSDPPISNVESEDVRSGRFLMQVVRLLFITLLVSVALLTVSSVKSTFDFNYATVIGLCIATTAVGVIVVVIDAMTPNKRIAGVVGIYIGVCFGLIGAVAFGALLDTVINAWEIVDLQTKMYLNLSKSVVGLIVCYLSVSVVLNTKDDFRLVIPYVEFSRTRRGVRPWIVDTSVLIDGRIIALANAKLLDAPLVIANFVIDELQRLADSGDKNKRARGRRGLENLIKLRENVWTEVSLQNFRVSGLSVDRLLIEAAKGDVLRILTNDSNLESVGKIQGVLIVNLATMIASLRPTIGVSDIVMVTIVKAGEAAGQGVGYLPDGTMVIVQDAATRIGAIVEATIANIVTTNAGRLLFAKMEGAPPATPASMAAAATQQPKEPHSPATHGDADARRNPRRS